MKDLQELVRSHGQPSKGYGFFYVSVEDAKNLLDEIKQLKIELAHAYAIIAEYERRHVE